jgi:hypothetical protein
MQGVKRTKLGLREFIRLGDFIQEINVEVCKRAAEPLPSVLIASAVSLV